MEKMHIDIVAIECPNCSKSTYKTQHADSIAVLLGETAVSITIRYICLSMECNHKWTVKYVFTKPKGGKNENK